MKKLYHMSSTNNQDDILINGITCGEDDYIYLINTLHIPFPLFNFIGYVPDIVVLNQISLLEYDLYEIDPKGIEQKLLPDNVMESTASIQKRAKQKKISKEFIKHIERRKVDVKSVLIYNDIALYFSMNELHFKKNLELLKVQNVSPEDQMAIPKWIIDSVESKLELVANISGKK